MKSRIKTRNRRLIGLAVALFPFFSACGFSQSNVQSTQSTDLESRRIKRIAVVAPAAAPAPAAARNPLLGTPLEEKPIPQDAEDFLLGQVYSTAASLPAWQIIGESEVRDAAGSVPPSNDLLRLRRIGEAVHADAVLTGRVQRFRERVGDEWGAKTPASVSFSLDLVDVRRGDVIWTARFDETQKGLTDNILALGDIGERGIRWLTARQLAQDGVRKVIQQLHQILVKSPAS